jgi:hypothetical protein
MSGNTNRINVQPKKPEALVLSEEIDDPIEYKLNNWETSGPQSTKSTKTFKECFAKLPVSPFGGSLPCSPRGNKLREEKQAIWKQNLHQTWRRNVEKHCNRDEYECSDDEFDLEPKKPRANKGVRRHKYSDRDDRNKTYNFSSGDELLDIWGPASPLSHKAMNDLKSLGFTRDY